MKISMGSLFWSLYAWCYDSLNVFRPYITLLGEVVKKIDLKPKLKILDIGCGTGNLVKAILEKQSEIEIFGIDFSEQMLRRARSKISRDVLKKVDISQGLSFDNGYFDVVTSINMMHILKEPKIFLDEASRVLRVGGRLIVVTLKNGFEMPLILKEHAHQDDSVEKWKADSFSGWIRIVFRTFGFTGLAFKFLFIAICNRIVDHEVAGFTQQEIEKIFGQSGFSIIEIKQVYGQQEYLVVAEKRI